jgi:hypothetical protein
MKKYFLLDGVCNPVQNVSEFFLLDGFATPSKTFQSFWGDLKSDGYGGV